MAQVNLEKVTTPQNAPVNTLGIFVTPDNDAFLVDENGNIYAFGGGAVSFLALTDVPNTYVDQAGKSIRVNVAENGLEFFDPSTGGGTWGTIIGPISDQEDLWNYLTSAVYITGNQTIEGIKTFSSSPIVPVPTTEFQAVNKGYIDDLIGEGTLIRSPQIFVWDGSNTVTLDFIPDDMLFVSLNGQLTDRWTRTGDQLTITDFASDDFIIVGYYKSLALVNQLPEARIEDFSLTVISDVLGEVTATWYNPDNVELTVTDLERAFAGTPESGDFRWDLIKLNFDGTVSIITGVEGTEPIRPSEGTGGLIGAELIWNDLGEFIIIEPSTTFPNDRYFTKPKGNNQGNFAKVLSGPLAKGQMYSLQLSYTNYSSDWVGQGKGDTGTLNVTFLSNNSNNINSTSVKIETVAGNSEEGDWVLVDATGGNWELWHKSKAFWGRTQFRVVFFNDVVNKNWFIQDAPYVASIPANDAEYPSEVFGGVSELHISAGAFTGVFDVSHGINYYYDDYDSGSVVNLSLSESKVLGSIVTVRIKGNLLGTVPESWNKSGKPFTTSIDRVNEITLMYVKELDVRLVNRVVDYIDTEPPSVPENLASSNITESTVDLTWDASTDNIGVTGYNIYQDSVLILSPTGTSQTVSGLTALTLYSFTVSALDASGNESAQSIALEVTTTDVPAVLTPISLTNLHIWVDGTDSGKMTLYDTNKVDFMNDKTDDFTLIRSGEGPVYDGTRLHFEELGALYRSTPSSLLIPTADFHGFLVFEHITRNIARDYICNVVNTSNRFAIARNGSALAIGTYNGSSFNSKSIAMATGLVKLEFKLISGVLSAWQNDVELTGTTNPYTSTTAGIFFGGTNTGLLRPMYFHDFFVKSGEMTTQERTDMLAYINDKYGI